jgi:ribonuclease HI
VPHVITAKHRTKCGLCPEPVQPGDRIAAFGERGSATWVHESCHPETTGGAAPAPRPAASKPARAAKVRPADQEPVAGAVEVWTDGACSGNPGPGGWAWATADGRQDSGGDPATTNQRMEIRAALEAVRTLEGPLVVVSDSTYVVNCFRDRWWEGWLARGWVNSARKPVANRDLWEPLVELVQQRGDVTFRWVKGHSGDRMNDLVDSLAVAAAAAVANRTG